MDQLGENANPGGVERMREDENESRSGSDNIEVASGDDQEAAAAAAAAGGAGAGAGAGAASAAPSNGRRPKKYHRHTPQQIQELESQENDRLRAENDFFKQAVVNPVCNTCGGPAVPGEVSYEQNHLKIENARLKDELSRVCSLTNKFLGWPPSSSAGPVHSQGLNSNLELAVGRNGFGGLNNAGGSTLPMEFHLGNVTILPQTKLVAHEIPHERSPIVDVALKALEELIKLAQINDPFWIKSSDGSMETLNLEEYNRNFSSWIGMKPSGYQTEASRATGLVSLRGSALIETLMDANHWAEMFPCLVSRAATIDVLSSGAGVTRDNALQVMDAEFQVISPLAPVRRMRFIRFCKKHSEGVWVVVDVSIDATRDAANTPSFINCRRLPSGCVIQDLDNKYTKVTWIEHSEYDESAVHNLLKPTVNSGLGFGAHRWIATLQRQSECLAVLMSADIPSEDNIGITAVGRKSMLKLAQRMTHSFCAGVGDSSVHKWEKINNIGCVAEDVRVMSKKNVNAPGEPVGVLLSAATSVWMPATQKRMFDFLREERMRIQWDILCDSGLMHEMIHVAKGPGDGNTVTLLRGGPITTKENMMLVLQESWSDASGALVIYAPVDVASMSTVMNGGDSAYVALLPSGFAILPCIPPSNHGGQSNSNGQLVKSNIDGNISGNGCILTVGFQILANSLPSAKLTAESVETVNNLISCTIQKIKAALTVT
ncbi:hypothetical protein V6N12_043294 [Hibiscus sabdariffa]|uniref:START domain-containing protein n=1 Tax=Hibiscus sabdariffa TaxID=183260 RepID=A0ABR2DDX5_9ROSI